MAFLLDDLLIGLPIAGFKFVFRQLEKVAAQEVEADRDLLRQEILDLNRSLDAGDIDERTFKSRERELMIRWRALRDMPKR